MPEFHIVSPYRMAGDQPQAVAKLVEGVRNGLEEQTLKGVTGSGKTFTMANIIEQTQRPTLVLAHNKTLAAQLCTELREFFPDNAVEYFVSYYDYYQPEAYIASTDTYIEKDSAINDEIDRLRHSATSALAERRDVIIVSSVSCIYSLGDPIDYKSMVISLRPGMELSRDTLIRRLIDIQYERNDIAFERNRFRVRGDTVEIWPVYSDEDVVRVEFFGDEVDRISRINPLTGVPLGELGHIAVFPASHYVTPKEKLEEAIKNYSRVLSRRAPGSSPYTLIDYFPKDFLLIVDESHVTLPQVRAMYHGDRARKESLVENGFRLPSAYDNRPLNFDEFNERLNQIVYVSATPGEYELSRSGQVVEQVIRPTGLLDPEVVVRPVDGQIDDLIGEINARTAKGERVLVTTLTKKMAEDLTDYLETAGIKVRYMHHDVKTIERQELVRDLRLGVYDVLVGINLLREGLDIPEVSLVAILDADKEGFLRSETSLIQTIGRAARNEHGLVVLYADSITPSMKRAMDETERRRALQDAFNKAHGITPRSVRKKVQDVIEITSNVPTSSKKKLRTKGEKQQEIARLTRQMKEAAKMLEFEIAAQLRDQIKALEEK